MDVRTSFVREEPLGLRCLTKVLATCVVEDVSIHLDIQTLEFWVMLDHPPFLLECKTDTASAACPLQLGNLAITSMIFCSSHLWRRRALFSEDCVGSRIVLYTVSSEHDSAFILLQFWFLLCSFEVAYVHQWSKVDSHFVSLPFQNNFFFALDFPCPMLDLSRAFLFFVHGSLCIRKIHGLWHRDKLMHQI